MQFQSAALRCRWWVGNMYVLEQGQCWVDGGDNLHTLFDNIALEHRKCNSWLRSYKKRPWAKNKYWRMYGKGNIYIPHFIDSPKSFTINFPLSLQIEWFLITSSQSQILPHLMFVANWRNFSSFLEPTGNASSHTQRLISWYEFGYIRECQTSRTQHNWMGHLIKLNSIHLPLFTDKRHIHLAAPPSTRITWC